MTIVGFNFTKINVEKNEGVKGKISVNNNVSVQKVEKTDLLLGQSKQKGLKINYEFKTTYSSNLGNILIEGNVLILKDEKEVTKIVENWKEKKNLPKDLMSQVLNTILNKCNVEALILSREIGLPSPIKMPSVEIKERPKK